MTDRKTLIRIASGLPPGDPMKKAILASLKANPSLEDAQTEFGYHLIFQTINESLNLGYKGPTKITDRDTDTPAVSGTHPGGDWRVSASLSSRGIVISVETWASSFDFPVPANMSMDRAAEACAAKIDASLVAYNRSL